MGSDRAALAARLSIGGWRLLLAACLVAGLIQALAAHYLLTALPIAAALALTLFDLWRLALRPAQAPASVDVATMPGGTQRLEQALALLEAVTIGLLLLDADGRVRFANRAARLLAGFDIGRLHDITLLGAGEADVILAIPVGGRRIVTLSDGRSLLVWSGSLSIPGGATQRLVSMQLVTGELDAVQLGAWHRMTRVLAHEMMNSLTPIIALSEGLNEVLAADPRLADAAATIARRSRHLMDFVERYRTIADLPEPCRHKVDLAGFLAGIDRLVRDGLVARGIDFAVERVDAGVVLPIDPALIEQALINLIGNAADALAGIADPRIRLACADMPGFVMLSVRDNGPGVADGLIEEIFVPFYTGKPGGAGIGLTLARQIAIAHGGSLSANRPGDRGIGFDLRLPKAPAAISVHS
jgi:two-component system nitrogen regulation sensor histidine kinase NtrY